jgi:hypothetical protein
MSYTAVKAKKSPPKATDWSGFKKGNLLKKTQLSWYQSIAKKHLWIHVKFDGGLSIPFTRKIESKKNGTFSKGVVCPFSKWRGLKGLKV